MSINIFFFYRSFTENKKSFRHNFAPNSWKLPKYILSVDSFIVMVNNIVMCMNVQSFIIATVIKMNAKLYLAY